MLSPDQIYKEVDHAVEEAIVAQGAGATGLAQAVRIAGSEPLIRYHDAVVKGATVTDAVKAQVKTRVSTILGADDVPTVGSSTKVIAKKVVNFTAFYIFFPVGIVFLIAIWLMMGFGWFDWATAAYLTLLIFLILYTFNVLYRILAQDAIDSVIDQNLSSTLDSFSANLPTIMHTVSTIVSSS